MEHISSRNTKIKFPCKIIIKCSAIIPSYISHFFVGFSEIHKRMSAVVTTTPSSFFTIIGTICKSNSDRKKERGWNVSYVIKPMESTAQYSNIENTNYIDFI